MKLRRTDSAVEALRSIPWFEDLQPEQVSFAARHVDWLDVAAGTRLQRQGFHAGWLWIPVDAPLDLRRNDGRVGSVRPGGAWGETEVLLGVPSSVEVIAAEPVRAVSLPAPVFHGMLGDAAFATTVARRQARASLRPSGLVATPA
jgi:CRP-like cAMP-binding protein